ncbi:DUF721 domain-containing protein [Rhodoferax sp. 4810]|uniref:DUF721 domain-containing protein n=1 Tax=Thiospirillum jenense TaxID=1653858 RepID=A0A839HBX4_9GAMM|nr:DciA family protein [Thiospirillum jenense]MBB1073122.1 DUF721 domain-containing protein [Rhodoferax jenense]MBB1124717.1 DUF721 domain-containing protein [Thiospirillum jenense]
MQALSDGCHQFTTVAQNHAHGGTLAGLLAESRRQAQLLQHIQTLLPAVLRPQCIHARLDRDQCLVLTVTSPVWAARLRMQMATVHRQLLVAGYAIVVYRIRVLPTNALAVTVAPAPPAAPPAPRLSTATREHLEQAAAELTANNPELAAVLLRLARR